jgi:hypothetical protein
MVVPAAAATFWQDMVGSKKGVPIIPQSIVTGVCPRFSINCRAKLNSGPLVSRVPRRMILLGIDLHGALVHVKYLIGVFMNFIIVFFHHAPQAGIQST